MKNNKVLNFVQKARNCKYLLILKMEDAANHLSCAPVIIVKGQWYTFVI